MVIIVDFGSQTTHLIERRIKELGVATKIITPENALNQIKSLNPKGIILSGGPSSVYLKGAPTIDPTIFELSIPILAICYGFQLLTHLLEGKVVSGKKEYGPAELKIPDEVEARQRRQNSKFQILNSMPKKSTVWMSHGDEVISLPKGFEILGSTENVPFAFVENQTKKIIGVLFHPEVEHTEVGNQLLSNFIQICEPEILSHKIDLKKIEYEIKEVVGEAYVIGAVSGGVDSTVAGTLVAKAIGKKFIPVFVDNGLMREGTAGWVKKIFTSLGVKPQIIECEAKVLQKLKGIVDPEEKREIIGNYYINIFEEVMKKEIQKGKDVKFLMQGTIYSDVIESQGTKHSSKIKSHHNVGGLPKKMKLKLLEPVRNFYKDEVRKIGLELRLPKEFIFKQPFPGPGYAVRIRGEVTKDRLNKAKKADKIILDELQKANLLKDVFISFPVMTGTDSTAVKGDDRFFGEVVALRVVTSKDVMTAGVAEIPYPILQKIASRIVNEVEDISRVVYDITTKPPATMEWE